MEEAVIKVDYDNLTETYKEERGLGMTSGPHTPSQAKTVLGGKKPHHLPLGARIELDKIRSIQDGSAPGINFLIQLHCLTRILLPGIQDSRQIVAIAKQQNITLAMLQLDYSKAHRRIPILEKDWLGSSWRPDRQQWSRCSGTASSGLSRDTASWPVATIFPKRNSA